MINFEEMKNSIQRKKLKDAADLAKKNAEENALEHSRGLESISRHLENNEVAAAISEQEKMAKTEGFARGDSGVEVFENDSKNVAEKIKAEEPSKDVKESAAQIANEPEPKGVTFGAKSAYTVSKTATAFKALQSGGTAAASAPAIGGTLAKMAPGVGTALGVVDTVSRANKGDYLGAVMSAASAAATTVPVVGTAVALGIKTAQIATDYMNITGKEEDKYSSSENSLPLNSKTSGINLENFDMNKYSSAGSSIMMSMEEKREKLEGRDNSDAGVEKYVSKSFIDKIDDLKGAISGGKKPEEKNGLFSSNSNDGKDTKDEPSRGQSQSPSMKLG
jgi:hypothetical protein